MFYTILMDLQETVRAAQGDVSVIVFFVEDTEEKEILALKEALEKRPEVAGVEYIWPAAWADFSQSYLGDQGELCDNPLKDSANLRIYMEDVGQQKALVEYLQSRTIVRSVRYSEAAAEACSESEVF